jgi:Tripartite tricarboxylate transporter family receptor
LEAAREYARKARPNGISIGSPGPGTTPHLSGVLFAARTGINAIHVPSEARRRPSRRSTPAEAAAFAAKETAMWREVVRLSGLTPQ